MKKLKYIATLLVSLVLIAVTLFILTETPAPAGGEQIAYTPAEMFDSAVGMITDTMLNPHSKRNLVVPN
ncbi:MAG: hypothetical protein KDD63_27475 [Bacteroidetes bacterium]|nr:hypothetical protein [Bacteroidota bacterium]MCB0846821.1 hypothetical protein [Bacteroidota bacterium]MCB0856006.1 hypothetical protein [Bacteroidota bacterium]